MISLCFLFCDQREQTYPAFFEKGERVWERGKNFFSREKKFFPLSHNLSTEDGGADVNEIVEVIVKGDDGIACQSG